MECAQVWAFACWRAGGGGRLCPWDLGAWRVLEPCSSREEEAHPVPGAMMCRPGPFLKTPLLIPLFLGLADAWSPEQVMPAPTCLPFTSLWLGRLCSWPPRPPEAQPGSSLLSFPLVEMVCGEPQAHSPCPWRQTCVCTLVSSGTLTLAGRHYLNKPHCPHHADGHHKSPGHGILCVIDGAVSEYHQAVNIILVVGWQGDPRPIQCKDTVCWEEDLDLVTKLSFYRLTMCKGPGAGKHWAPSWI